MLTCVSALRQATSRGRLCIPASSFIVQKRLFNAQSIIQNVMAWGGPDLRALERESDAARFRKEIPNPPRVKQTEAKARMPETVDQWVELYRRSRPQFLDLQKECMDKKNPSMESKLSLVSALAGGRIKATADESESPTSVASRLLFKIRHLDPPKSLFDEVFKAFTRKGDTTGARQFLNRMGTPPSQEDYAALLDAYHQRRDYYEAEKLFRTLKNSTETTYLAMMNGCLKTRRFTELLDYAARMKRLEIPMSEATLELVNRATDIIEKEAAEAAKETAKLAKGHEEAMKQLTRDKEITATREAARQKVEARKKEIAAARKVQADVQNAIDDGKKAKEEAANPDKALKEPVVPLDVAKPAPVEPRNRAKRAAKTRAAATTTSSSAPPATPSVVSEESLEDSELAQERKEVKRLNKEVAEFKAQLAAMQVQLGEAKPAVRDEVKHEAQGEAQGEAVKQSPQEQAQGGYQKFQNNQNNQNYQNNQNQNYQNNRNNQNNQNQNNLNNQNFQNNQNNRNNQNNQNNRNNQNNQHNQYNQNNRNNNQNQSKGAPIERGPFVKRTDPAREVYITNIQEGTPFKHVMNHLRAFVEVEAVYAERDKSYTALLKNASDRDRVLNMGSSEMNGRKFFFHQEKP